MHITCEKVARVNFNHKAWADNNNYVLILIMRISMVQTLEMLRNIDV